MINKQIQKLSKFSLVLALFVLTFILGTMSAHADPTQSIICSDGQTITVSGATTDFDTACKNQQHGGYNTPSTSTKDTDVAEPTGHVNDCGSSQLNRDNCGIVKYIVIFINLLSALVGVVVTAVIIAGGIQYSTSSGDPSKVQAAKKRIFNGVLSLALFIFTYAFLQWVVPGGVL